MPVPDYQSFMLPLMELAEDGKVHAFRDAIEHVADKLGLTKQDRAELYPSGKNVLYDRVHWARTYLEKAGLLHKPFRAHLQITQRGAQIMKMRPQTIDTNFLWQFPEFQEFQSRSIPGNRPRSVYKAEKTKKQIPDRQNSTETRLEIPPLSVEIVDSQTPEEAIESGYQILRQTLAGDLLDRIKASPPAFFEGLVIDLLVAMGYGGSRADAGHAIGRSGDGGIDGIIKEDRLGLDVIYIQAKRWENTVGRPQIQEFVGSLEGLRANKGIFITTSDFSQQAREYVRGIGKKIVLIDGSQLAEYMIDFGVGVSEKAVYVIKRIDEDYFSGE